MADYEAPTITELGSLQDLTLAPGGSGSFHKAGGAPDGIITGEGGAFTYTLS